MKTMVYSLDCRSCRCGKGRRKSGIQALEPKLWKVQALESDCIELPKQVLERAEG